MTELKTLKDIRDQFDIEDNSVDYDRLRVEAIKWVKKSRSLKAEGRRDYQINEYSWMEFFGLSEEDLK